MLTKRQVNEMVRLLKNASIADLSHVAHGLAVDCGSEAAKLQLNYMAQLLSLPRIISTRGCNVTFLSVPENRAIPTIKLLRDGLKCGLREAKEMYDTGKCHLPANVAEEVIAQLRQIGIELKVEQA